MEFRSLRGVDDHELLRVFNEAFANYFVPVQLTLEQLREMIVAEYVDPDLSVGAFANDELVGFILHATDHIDGRNVVYNAGTGVIAGQRGQNVTHRMYDFVLPALRARKVDEVVLEVIRQNVPAIKIYERIGFVPEWRLLCYKGPIIAEHNAAVRIDELSHYDWKRFNSFRDFSPTWQNSNRTLDGLKETNKLYGAFLDDVLAGYLVYNTGSKRVQQFAVHPEYRRRGVASAVFAFVRQHHTESTVIVNVDARYEATHAFLKKIGLELYVEQEMMRLELGRET